VTSRDITPDSLCSSISYCKSIIQLSTLLQTTEKYLVRPSVNAGFTLIEVMITMVVLSVGLLGIALMQVHGLNFTTGAYARTQASYLAYEILDEMRMSATPANYISTGSAGNCSPLLVSDTNNLSCWYAQIKRPHILPNGGACISSANGTYTVEIYWTRLKTRDSGSLTSTVCSTTMNDVDSIKMEAVL